MEFFYDGETVVVRGDLLGFGAARESDPGEVSDQVTAETS